MKQLFHCADRYIQSSDWRMLAGLKFCLCAIGVLLGLTIPQKHKKTAAAAAEPASCCAVSVSGQTAGGGDFAHHGEHRHDHRPDACHRHPPPVPQLRRLLHVGLHGHAVHLHRSGQERKEVFLSCRGSDYRPDHSSHENKNVHPQNRSFLRMNL